ncbi:MAG: urate hydroxylase PuuD [Ramlibacter sp.]
MLGPSLGQCCGGVVHLKFEAVSQADLPALQARLQGPLAPLALFGGHVGRALVQALGLLLLAVRWIDSRDEIFRPICHWNVACEFDPVQAAVAALAPGTRVLIMSFSHAEDLDVVAACPTRLRSHNDLPFVGLIGSQTKWATFRHRLEARGFSADELARVTCPIGLPGIAGKQPEVIAGQGTTIAAFEQRTLITMESYLLDWANLLLRWVHVITAIAWVGSSFYFVFLDSSLTPPVDEDLKKQGVSGELCRAWRRLLPPCQVCGVAAPTPGHLHWFYWESYFHSG